MAYTKLMVHIVFSTKDRRPFLQGDVLDRVCKYIGGIVRGEKGHMLTAGGAADHVHLAAMLHPTVAIANFLRKIKANSSKWIHDECKGLAVFNWQDGYSAFSVSQSVMPEVVRYIEGQQAHHRKQTFQEELIALLVKHGVEYDERYIWS